MAGADSSGNFGSHRSVLVLSNLARAACVALIVLPAVSKSLKIDFALAQDDTLPISERAKIPADPHSTSTVALTWDDWHKRIVEKLYNEIYRQIETLLADHQHLHCRITYRIRKLGQIELLKIEGSENLVFRGTVTRAVESLQNNPIIIFPECAGNATSITKRSEFDFHMRL